MFVVLLASTLRNVNKSEMYFLAAAILLGAMMSVSHSILTLIGNSCGLLLLFLR